MADLLAKIQRDADPARNPFLCDARIKELRDQIAASNDPVATVRLRQQLVRQLLLGGYAQGALKENEVTLAFIRTHGLPLSTGDRASFGVTNAVCDLRIGEQENCLLNHTADSCLFPIQGGGVHQLQQGSRAAVDELTEVLRAAPGDLRARWLLNIAYMTLGEYPDKVPSDQLIAPQAFASDYDIKRFPDVAGRVGLDRDDVAGGVVLEDFDNDGLLDLMVSAWSLDGQLRLYRNRGDGTFPEVTVAAGLVGEVGGLNLIQCDYNNDGRIDVLVLRGAWLQAQGHYPMSLLRNDGDLHFTDVTEEAGLLRLHPTQAAVWLDYNGDGLIDLFVAPESDEQDRNPCELFRNNGDGTFTECARESGVALVGFFKGTVSADYNGDGRPDILVSARGGPKLLLRNDGPVAPGSTQWHFTDVAAQAGITEPVMSFPCWFFDYDNDGHEDIFLAGYALQDLGDVAADYLHLPYAAERAKLYHNNGDGTFTDVSRAMGVNRLLHTMGCNFGDLDNDGWLDFYVGTGDPEISTLMPSRMFRNAGGKRFQDVTTSGNFGQLQKGHAIAFGDINNDGEQDIFSVVGGAFEADHAHRQLFANPGHGNHWLKLTLQGVRSNRAAIGAHLTVVVRTPAGERRIARTVNSGGSFGSSSFRQEIGLGDALGIDRVEISWPASGLTQTLRGLALDRAYRVREGDAAASPQTLKRFAWPMAGPGAPYASPSMKSSP